jgi:hypothetical protein
MAIPTGTARTREVDNGRMGVGVKMSRWMTKIVIDGLTKLV